MTTAPVVLITGSSSGIGAATARSFADRGAHVIVNSRSSTEAGEALASSLPSATYVQGDVTRELDAERIIEAALRVSGTLDVLVNNAGRTRMIPHADLEAADLAVWQEIFATNVFGTWNMCLKALPWLRRSDRGAIVNVSSAAGSRCTGSSIPYAASKAALNHQTRLLARVVGPSVTVNAVAPGLIDTPWTADWHRQRETVQSGTPLGRVGQPEDVAQVIVNLASSRYVTGEVVLVDGGLGLGAGSLPSGRTPSVPQGQNA